MSDKDQFTFEDDDDFPETNLNDKEATQISGLGDEDFPETSLGYQSESPELDLNYADDSAEADLSAAFSEGEHVADESTIGEPVQKVKDGSKTRILLMILLLIIACGAGAYYFMGLGGTTPSTPTVSVPAQKTTKSVALPSPPAQKSVASAKAEPAAKPVTVAVPPPAEPAAKAAQTKQPATVATKETPPATKSVEKDTPAKVAPAPASKKATASIPPAPAPVESVRAAGALKATEPANQVVDGAFMLDAGAYLMESNRKSLVVKIKKLGYKPLVTPIDATLDMTRLRLGTFSKDEVKEALDFARTIEPGAYSAPAGDGYVVYAGTFLKTGNVDKLSQRFFKEGIKVHPEPVQVVRTLNRIRFGSFATRADATAAARELSTSGLKAVVVKSK